MFVVIAYDIRDDRRRVQLHDVLLDYGDPVQYSVFQCEVSATQMQKLKRRAKRLIKPSQDRLHYYFLCKKCVDRIERKGVDSVQAEPETPGAFLE